MGFWGVVSCVVMGLILLYVAGVYLFDFIAGIVDRRHPRNLTPDEQRAEDYAAYKAKMR